MTEYNQREYQSVILAALLHDVGKFLQRPEGKSKTHPEDGANFVASYEEGIKNIGFDFQTSDNIIRYHQGGSYQKNIDDPHQKALVALVSASDGFASGERDYEREGGESLGYNPLDPAFAYIDLGLDRDTDIVKTYKGKGYHYEHKVLSFLDTFPSSSSLPEDDEDKKRIKADYENLQRHFKNDFKSLLNGISSIKDTNQKMNTLLVSLYSLLYKYTWSIPDNVGLKIRDISLFDHTRLSAAISACLYIYHHMDNSLDRMEDVLDEDKEKFLLIKGDLSGIQDYLYSIANIGIGGVAKRLRTRSFFLSSLVEVISHRILHRVVGDGIELPLVCKFMSGGGNFIVLSPNVEGVEKNLMSIEKELNRWLFKEFQGDLSFSIASLPIRGIDFEIKREETKKRSAHESHITQRLIELHDLLERKKGRKLSSFLSSGDNKSWEEDNFLWRDKTFPYGDCPSCKKNPAVSDGKEVEDHLCERCDSDRRFSERLVKANYICYGREGLTTNKDDTYGYFDGGERYWVRIVESEPEIPLNSYMVQTMDPSKILYDKPTFFAPHANYVSLFEDRGALDTYCKEHCGKEPSTNRCEFYNSLTNPQGTTKNDIKPSGFPAIKPFECLAASLESERLLGVLKADVDRLGIIFSEGIGEGRRSLSRVATLSRMLDIFFSGWIDHIMRSDKGFQETYTVYSGGDDLMLVGPWDEIIGLSTHIAEEFRRYVACNPHITISAGIAVTKPKYPIAKSSSLANSFLKRAKEGKDKDRKNRLHLFGTTPVWFKKRDGEVEVSELMDWAKRILKLMETTDKDKRLSSGVVYSILRFSEMCRDWLEGDKRIENLRYLSLMAYTIGRNVKDRETMDDLKAFIDDVDKQGLFSKFRIPITWALLNYRGRRDKHGTI